MNRQKAAVEDLRQYLPRRESLVNIAGRIKDLQSEYNEVKMACGNAKLRKGDESAENLLLDNIVESQRLRHSLSAVRRLVTLTERGLSGLDRRERMVLEGFYATPAPGHAERLMDEIGCPRARLFRMKDEALYRFTVLTYGVCDS